MFERDVEQGEEVLGRCRRRIPNFGHERVDLEEEPRLPLADWFQVSPPGAGCVDFNYELMVFVLELNPLFVQDRGWRLWTFGHGLTHWVSVGIHQAGGTTSPRIIAICGKSQMLKPIISDSTHCSHLNEGRPKLLWQELLWQGTHAGRPPGIAVSFASSRIQEAHDHSGCFCRYSSICSDVPTRFGRGRTRERRDARYVDFLIDDGLDMFGLLPIGRRMARA